MAYCSDTDIQKYATGFTSGADAISYATRLINIYTGDIFETVTGYECWPTVDRAGVAWLPVTVQSVSTVVDTSSNITVPTTLYQFQNTARRQGIRLQGLVGVNILVAGFEPWNRWRQWMGARLHVTATAGWATTPAAVREATAILAAQYLLSTNVGGTTVPTDLGSQYSLIPDGVSAITVEGYSVQFRDNGDKNTVTGTGVPAVDRMLAPYRRSHARWN